MVEKWKKIDFFKYVDLEKFYNKKKALLYIKKLKSKKNQNNKII